MSEPDSRTSVTAASAESNPPPCGRPESVDGVASSVSPTPDTTRQLLRELEAREGELKAQNAELLRIQHDLELSRKRYFELYDRAPVGYFTLSPTGLIQDVNLTAAVLLGREKNDLLGCDFRLFIHPDDITTFSHHHTQLDDSMAPQSCEIRLLCGEECAPFWAHLQAGLSACGEYRIALTDIHERKNDEIKLQESEERFRKLVMAAKIGVVQQERNGTIITWNETAERVFGLSASRAIGLDATSYDWKTFREDGRPFPGSEHPSMQTLATGEPCSNIVMKVVRDSGDFTWISVNTGPLFRHGESTPYAVVVTFADITERKQAEAVLQARLRISDYAYEHPLDELLTKIIDETEALTNSRIGFFHFVEDDQESLSLQTWSSNTLKTACGTEVRELHYALDRAGVWADCIRQRKPLVHNDYASLPHRRGLPEGHVPLVRELVVPIFRASRIVAVMGVGNKPTDYTVRDLSLVQHLANLAWDVVKRKRAEQQLNVTREILSLFVKNSPVYAYIKEVTPTGSRVLEVSDNFQQMIGMPGEEMIGKAMGELFPEDVAERIMANDRMIVGAGQPVQQEEIFCGRYYTSYKFPIIFEDQTLLAGFSIDITERKQMEEALLVKSQQLEELNQSLEQRIDQAIQELRNKDELLIQQGRLAAMGEMINNIAHQWRQPLNNIGLIVQNLQFSFKAGTLTTTIMNRDIATTMQLLQQMSGTIDDFRNFFSHDKIVQTFQVNEAIRRSLNFMLPVLKSNNVEVRCTEECEVQADGYPGEYTQAILNILTNAKDVLLERAVAEPCIDIRIFSDKAGRSVVVIGDNGGGIAPEVLPRIFDPYFTTRKKGEGTGIGLFMSKIIIEKNMGGRLTVRNRDGGAEFRIVL